MPLGPEYGGHAILIIIMRVHNTVIRSTNQVGIEKG